jgi:16S rRNA (guanine966-N2)-methyltransferase
MAPGYGPSPKVAGVRVVAGEARGRRLVAPAGRDTRPTLDRVREAVFNALGSLGAVEGSRVLDLFAGSGALGIEALSRGAAHATFVDSDRSARRAIEENLAATGLGDRATVVGLDAVAHLRRHLQQGGDGYGLVLLDPPYAMVEPLWDEVLDLVGSAAPDAVVVVESDRTPAIPEGWDALREKRYGGTLVTVLRTPSPPPEPS